MRNSYARQLMDARNRGVDYGLKGMAMMATLAVDNVLKDYHDDPERAKILKDFDAEVYRIWREFKEETLKKNQDINDLIVGYYERLMKGVQDETD